MKDLESEIRRLTNALAPPSPTPPSTLASPKKEDAVSYVRGTAATGVAVGVALAVWCVATGHLQLLPVALILMVVSGIFVSTRAARALEPAMRAVDPQSDPLQPRIAMGANVSEGATIEPGAVVGMGANIGKGATLKRGAVVRAGANIGKGAVVEENAVVSWGVNVSAGAVIGAGAFISSGTNIAKNARVPPGMHLASGTNFKANIVSAGVSAAPLPAPAPKDPRLERMEAACKRLETELAAAPEVVRTFTGASASTVSELRRACQALIERELSLRNDARVDALPALEAEKTALAQKAAASSDPAIRASLQSAIAAIDEQKRQREAMGAQADRLEAELTRMLWTLDAMGTQLTRTRSAGQQLTAGDVGLGASFEQLQSEIGAIADALNGMAAVSPISDPDVSALAAADPQRTR